MKNRKPVNQCCIGLLGGVIGSMLTITAGVCIVCLLCPKAKNDLCSCITEKTEENDQEENE